MSLSTLVLTTLVVVPPGIAAASDWPQFRGPDRDGQAAAQAVARSWTEGGPAELWRRPLGSGFSTVTSVGDRLYTMAATEEHEEVFCLDAPSGATVWQVPLGARFPDKFGDGPRATPTVDGDTLFAVTSNMQLAALSVEDGAERWRIDLLEAFGIEQPRFGFSASVIVVEDRVILEIGGGEGQAVVAFDRDTGEVLWSALDGPAGKSSPLLVELGGVPQLVFHRRPDLVSLSLDGEVLWTHPSAPDAIAMAQFCEPDLLFVSSASMGKGGVMLRVTEEQGAFTVEPVWVNRRFRNHFNNSVVADGHLYGFDNSTLRCVEVATGDVRWSERGLGKGSLIACGDLLFVLGDQGTLVLVAATPDSYQELGRVEAMEGRCWTSPTLASGRLLLRNLEEVVAYDVRSAASEPADIAAVAEVPGAAADQPGPGAEAPELDRILEGYATARGGLERWREVQTLKLEGTFSAFSESGPFTLLRHREDRYRFDYSMAGDPDVRGRDAEGLWWVFHLFEIAVPTRVEIEPYHAQLRRESMFEPALLGAADKGIAVEWVGPGEVNGRPTLDLRLTFPDQAVETWRLDPGTYLEVAVDSVIVDMTQAMEPMDRRAFYSDFRPVDGLVLPLHVATEFGARLEELDVASVQVDPVLDADAFTMPVTEGGGEEPQESGEDG